MAENDLSVITKKILSSPNDFRAQVPKDSTYNKRYHLADYAVRGSGSYSFIVDWELPTNENSFDKKGEM